jgi:hypothetical protein
MISQALSALVKIQTQRRIHIHLEYTSTPSRLLQTPVLTLGGVLQDQRVLRRHGTLSQSPELAKDVERHCSAATGTFQVAAGGRY